MFVWLFLLLFYMLYLIDFTNPLFLMYKKYIIMIFYYVYVCVWVWLMQTQVVSSKQKWSVWCFDIWVKGNCVLLTRVLGTQHWSAVRLVSTLNCWTIHSNLGFICLLFIFSINFKCKTIRYKGYTYVNFTHVHIYCKLHLKTLISVCVNDMERELWKMLCHFINEKLQI